MKKIAIFLVVIILCSTLTFYPNVKALSTNLSEALDNNQFTWNSQNDRFYGQTDTYYYDNDAAESELGGDLVTTTNLETGTFSYYWKINSDYGILYFEIKNLDQNQIVFSESIEDQQDWDQVEYNIDTPGEYRIRWWFNPHPDIPGKAWVDKVEYNTDGGDNNPPDMPTIIDPLTEAYTKVGMEFTTLTTDSENDQIYYKFKWGDGTTSDWIGPCNSGEECYDIHYWNTEDTYNIQVKAKDSHGETSDWSQNYPISITEFDETPNYPPLKPATPDGPTTGELGKKYSFSTITIDPENDDMVYQWDMDGDQESIELTDFIRPLGSAVEYTWYQTGTYAISVIACDQYSGEGPWSEPHYITINPSDEEFIPITPSISGPDEGYIAEDIFLTTMSYDLNDEDIRYKWDFGDGTDYQYTDYITSGESITVKHKWGDEGAYNIRVKAENINNEVSSWSDLKTINIKHDKTSTTYYPVDDPNHVNGRKFSTPKANKDFFAFGLSLGPLEDIFYKRNNFVNESSGQIGTFSLTAASPPAWFWADGYSEACQRVDFEVGREKEILIEAEITQLNGVHTLMGGIANNQKIIHIDDFNDESKTVWMPFGDDDLMEKTVEASLYSVLLYLMTHVKKDQLVRTTLETIYHNYFFNGENLIHIQKYIKTIKVVNKIFLVATLILFFLDLGFFIWDKMSYEDLDHWFSELEKSGDAVTSYIRVPYNFKEGSHKIWAGLKTYTTAPVFGICGATGFTVGKVNQIKLHGISPPTKPILDGPTKGNIHQEISLKMKSEDHDDGGDPLDYIIDWDDGKTTTTNKDYNSGQQITKTHTYTSPGTYTITVTAIDCDNMESKHTTHTINIENNDNNPPTVEIYEPVQGIYFYDNQIFSSAPIPPFIIGDITIRADAYDDCDVEKVTFKKDNINLGIDTRSGYSIKCYLPTNGIEIVNFKAIAEDYAGNTDTDTQTARYWNRGQQNMMVTQTEDNSPGNKQNYNIKIPQPEGTSQTEFKQGVDELRNVLNNDYNGAEITFSYDVDYGDGTPIETIQKQYPILQINHQYQDKNKHIINVTMTTTLKINDKKHLHKESFQLEVGKSKSKNKENNLNIFNKIFQRSIFLSKIIDILIRLKEKYNFIIL